MPDNLPHLKVDGFFNSRDYTYPATVVGDVDLVQRNRNQHGNRIIQQLNSIRDQFQIDRDQPQAANIVRDDAVYVEFVSEWGYELPFNSFHSDSGDEPKYQLLNIRKETAEIQGEQKVRYRVAVMMREGGVSKFLNHAGKYLVENTKDRQGLDTGLPKYRDLFSNIADIALATLRAFWVDAPEIPFPNDHDLLWWEVWFRRSEDPAKIQRVTNNLAAIGAQIGIQRLEFPEHTVCLVQATANQLSQSILLLDNLAELRKAQELNSFITHPSVDFVNKQAWVNDLLQRLVVPDGNAGVVVCLLDSGVNQQHPLLQSMLPANKLFTYRPGWGTADSWGGGGHGTGMCGLVLFGDLTDALAAHGAIQILHGVESFKYVHPSQPHAPELYGVVTEEACSTPEVQFPDPQRIFCLAITDEELAFKGRPSNWSASVDRIAFGTVTGRKHLFIISGGNVDYLNPPSPASAFPDKNDLSSIHDPGQSFNAITVGSYTRMDRIDQQQWPNTTILSAVGAMSPSNSTSMLWENQWPIKPDIVMEGGNLAVVGQDIKDHVSTLRPLSLDKDIQQFLLYPFGDTSGAAALAAKLAAELQIAYPQFWPETIRGLLIHSAEWTPAMLQGIQLPAATRLQKRNLLRTVGYGVPIAKKASYSANNVLTLIAENTFQPFRQEGTSIKTNEYHLYSLPWPLDVLQNVLQDQDVTVKVTLSYFIDPNPGNRRYANNFTYYSHALDFKMIGPAEDLETFTRRVSKAGGQPDVPYDGHEEPWLLKEFIRSRGSIKKDFLICSGADLALRNTLAIYPKNGWYRTRKKLGLSESILRYSLLISIETADTDIDIYTPVKQIIENLIEV